MDTKKIKFSMYMITVLISLYSAYRFGKNDMVATMLTAVIILGIGGYYIIKKQEYDPFVRVKETFALMWTGLYLVLPVGGRPIPDNISVTIQYMSSAFGHSENSLVFYYAGALILLLIFGKRWKDTLAYRAGLYGITSLVTAQLFNVAFQLDTRFMFFVAIFAFMCEYISKKRFQYRSLFKGFILFCITLFVILILYPDAGLVTRILDLFYWGNIWPAVTIILLVFGAICIIEDYQGLYKLSEGKMSKEFETGCALICMAVYIFLGKAWPQFFNMLIVYIAAPAAILLAEYAEERMATSKARYFVWIGLLFFLPTAGRTLNERSWYYFVIIAILVVRFVLLKITWKNDKKTIILQDFWGIAAAVLLFSSRYEIFDVYVFRTLTFSLIVLAGSCVLWVILTHNAYAFDKQLKEGKYTKYDYEVIPRLQKSGICMVMVMALFSLLL